MTTVVPAHSESSTEKLSSVAHLTVDEVAKLSLQTDNTPARVVYKDLYRNATRSDLYVLAVSTLCAIIAGATLPLMAVLYGSLAGTFQGFFQGTVTGAAFTHEVDRLTLYYVYLAVGQFVTVYASTVGFAYVGEHITAEVRARYLSSLLRQNMAYFDTLGAGEIITRITADTNHFQDGISGKVALTIQAVATFIAAYVVGLVAYWKLALILTSTIVAIVLTGGLIGGFSARCAKENLASCALGGTVIEESLSSIRNTVAAGIQTRLVSMYDEHLGRAELPGFKLKFASTAILGFMMCYVYLTYALAFWLGARYVTAGDCSLGNVLTILVAIMTGAFALGNVSPNIQAFSTAVAAASKIYATTDRTPALQVMADGGITVNAAEFEGKISFQDIKHVYPSRSDVLALDSVSFTALANKTTALVGASGSGKSSIIALLERFYEPTSGAILIDGVNIEQLNLGWLRQQIGLVSQEPVLFAMTITQNIRLGLVGTIYEDLPDDDEQVMDLVVDAAKTADAHDFISAFPDGYRTNVSSLSLSGGQKQRIAIARAVVNNPKILLLDEATSALDTKSEAIVQAALNRISRGRTTIVIAHRLSTIKRADDIIVMSQGRIVEQGTHSELLEAGGFYLKLINAQVIGEHKKDAADLEPKLEQYEENTDVSEIKSLGDDPEFHEATVRPADNALIRNKSSQHSLVGLIAQTISLNAPDWPYLLAGVLCALITGAGVPVQSVFLAKSISSLALPEAENAKTATKFWSWMFFMLAMIQLFGYLAQGYAMAWCSERLIRRTRNMLFQAILRQDVAFFDEEGNTSGALVSFISTTSINLAGISGSTLSTILSALVTLVAGFIVALVIGWKLALVCISTVPLVLAAGFLRVWLLARFEAQSKQVYEKSASYACEAVSAIRTVVSLTREDGVMHVYRQQLFQQRMRSLRSISRSGALFATSQSLSYCVTALSFWYGSKLIANEGYSLFQFFVCFSATIFGAQAAGTVFSFAPDIGKTKQAIADIKTTLDRKPSIDTWSRAGTAVERVSGEIEFRDVHFRYPVGARAALRGLNLHIKPGQFVALVGASGCGKSTAIALLEQFYRPDTGKIFLDNVDMSTLNVSDCRRHMALVSQEPTLFQGTIRENILMGTDEQGIDKSDERIHQLCKDANIFELIQSLPLGLDTDVGSKGVMLSGGQKQRICIARALIRTPKILLLDESTSALDSESEKVVQTALDRAARGRTTIAVAHRLSSIQQADVIFVMDGGRVIEKGSHSELVAANGRYAELVQLQSLTGN